MPEQPQPYIGPRAFKPEDAPFFFGRDREANELLSLVISHAEVLLYAQSGAGKTSLINAKLLSLLEKGEGLEVLPLATMRAPPSTLPQSQIANIYVFNTLLSWAKGAAAPDKLAKMTLRKFLEQREQPMDKEGLPKPCVAIFDQFEELFTSYREHWEQRRGFFEQARDALDANPRLRTLFAMRDDYVAAIDRYARIMPEEFRIRFHLENLREPQALEAITGPLKQDQRRHFAPGVAEKLVKELMKVEVETASGQTESITGEFVEPIMLQVVCERLWRDLKPEDTEITLAHLETISVEKALLGFYEESIKAVAQQTHIPEPVLRSWFEKHLVTPAGTRGMVFRGETETEGLRNDAVDALDKLHLIRSQMRGGSQWYELTHDRFIDSVRRSHERVLSNLQAGAAEVGQRLEEKAAEWDDSGRTRAGLLTQNELLEAQHWLKSPEAAALGFSEKVMTLVEASRAEAQAHSARRRKALMYALGTLCLIALAAATYAFIQRQNAIRRSNEAEIQRTEASQQRQIAESQAALTLARNLSANSAKHRRSDLSLALILNLEAKAIADEIKPRTPSQVKAKASLLAEAKGGLLDGLVVSPHLRRFLHGHAKTVRSVAFSPRGNILASGGYDAEVILWDLKGYPLGPPLKGHTKEIYSVAFSPDGKKVASCSADGTIIFWDVEKHDKIRSVPLDQGQLDIVAFSPDGSTLACGTEAGTVVLLDIESGRLLQTLQAHKGRVYGLAFSPVMEAKKFASSGADKKIVFWNFSYRKRDGAVEVKREKDVEDNNEVFSIAFSPDGKTLASGNRSNEVTLWDVAKTNRLGLPLKDHTDPVFSVAFSPDGTTLVSASIDTTIRCWDVAKRQPLGGPLTGSSKPVYSVAFNPDGKTLASGADLGVVVLWDITQQSLLAFPYNISSWIYRLAVTPDGKTMAASDDVGNITVVSESLNETFKAHKKMVTSVAFSADGTTLASASMDGSIQLRSSDGKTWNRSPRSLTEKSESINSIAFNPIDNKILASGDANGAIVFWDVAAGKSVGTLPKQETTVNSVAFSPDGKTLASGNEDSTIVLWNVASGKSLDLPFVGHHDSVSSVAFSPDGKMLVSGSKGHDSAVILWDTGTGRSLDVFREHTNSVQGVAFSQDGTMVASCSRDQSIILWDVAARESIASLVTEKAATVYAVAFLPDGELVSAAWGVTDWDIRLASLRNNADHIAGRNLTADEWESFVGERPYRPSSLYGSLEEADGYALRGDLERARKSFKQVVDMAVKEEDAVINNEVAWYGTLDKFPDIILPACDRAIALAQDENKPGCRDTRGVARAMTRKIQEAIEDFQAYATWSKTEQEKEDKAAQGASSPEEKAQHQKEAASSKKLREKREQWIVDLKSGRNPFDAATLMKLRREGSE